MFWDSILGVLILLLAAMSFGVICERLRQSAVLGYLVAGTLLGPYSLNWVSDVKLVTTLAELGVSLLLFTIGLEFSWKKLKAIGAIAFGGGLTQVIFTALPAAMIGMLFGLSTKVAFAIGVVIALSSTAGVLRILMNRAEVDSVHGRNALGILLFQDVAVVPLVLIMTLLSGQGSGGEVFQQTIYAVAATVALIAIFYLVCNFLMPRILNAPEVARNRDLPILLAMILALGASWTAHHIGISPAVGAFIAGLVLGESPFSTQIRSDVASLRALFMTLFFVSIGMLGDPAWAMQNSGLILALLPAVIVGKALIATGAALMFGSTLPYALATGLCLAQVGEFSFVLAKIGLENNLFDDFLFKLIVSLMIGTLFFTPYLVALAPRLAATVGRLQSKKSAVQVISSRPGSVADRRRILIIGFGPAGQRVAAELQDARARLSVIELNPASLGQARALGLKTYIGDASRPEVLEAAKIYEACAVVITIPDPGAARRVVDTVRALAPDAVIIARARWHLYSDDLRQAGAHYVIDEEDELGTRIASQLRAVVI